jgi:hypothetical protein
MNINENNRVILPLSSTLRATVLIDIDDPLITDVIFAHEVSDSEAEEAWVIQVYARLETHGEKGWVEITPYTLTEEFHDHVKPLLEKEHGKLLAMRLATMTFKPLYVHVPILAHRLYRRENPVK